MKGLKITMALGVGLAILMILGPMVNAETLTFSKSVTTGDTINGTIDIVKIGAYTQGSYQYFYLETQNAGINQPATNDAYSIEISVEADVDGHDQTEYLFIMLMWTNVDGNITENYYYSLNDGQSSSKLSNNDVTISGTRVTVRVPALALQNVGVYNVEFVTSELSPYSGDKATYYIPSSGNAGGNNDNGGDTGTTDGTDMAPMWLPFLGFGLAIVCGIVFFIIWLLLAIWAYKDAKKKCMSSPIIWFLVVFFLGIIGLIIYIVIRKDECQKQQPQNMPPPPPPA